VTQIITKQAKLVKCNPKQLPVFKVVKKSMQPQDILKGFSLNTSVIIFRGAYLYQIKMATS